MGKIKTSTLIIRSLIAMAAAAITGSIGFVLIEGGAGSLTGFFGMLFWVVGFALLAWLASILPLLRPLYQLARKESTRFLFPFLSAIYGSLVFNLLFLIFFGWQGPEMFVSKLGLLAAAVGFLWGFVFVLQIKKK